MNLIKKFHLSFMARSITYLQIVMNDSPLMGHKDQGQVHVTLDSTFNNSYLTQNVDSIILCEILG